MRRILLSVFCILAVATAFLLFQSKTLAQSSFAQTRITQAIDETKLTVLRGNTHPSARPEADQGAAPPDLRMDHMTLVLTPSAEQNAALAKLLQDQQNPSSPSYHKWLTPDQFGQQFGASEADIQSVTSWLLNHGFSIDVVTRGRTLIQFSGTAANVKDAFHTEIHKYFVNGQEHWANASDPQIPSALAPVVAGVATLHDFHRKPMSRRVGSFSMNRVTHEVRPLKPQFTFGTGCGLNGGTCYLVGPADFNTIYSVPASSTGAGVTISIVGDSNINPADATDFFTLFDINRSAPNIIFAGTDPGITDDEIEADIDTQWAGAIAPGAAINLVIAANTNAANGVDIAAECIVNLTAPNCTTKPQILSESFGDCEVDIGAAGNQMFGGVDGNEGLWGQAAMEGISVIVSAGDSGSAGCENPTNNGQNTPPQPATSGLAVSGLASTWNNTSVGGTDFNQYNNWGTFWNSTNTAIVLPPMHKNPGPTATFIGLACVSFFGLLFLGLRLKHRNWGAAFAVLACALFLTCAACGGGSSSTTVTLVPSLQLSAKGPIPETAWNDSCVNILFTTPGLGFDSTVLANCNDNNVLPSFIVPQGGGGGPSSCAITSGAGCTGYSKPPYQTALTSTLDNFRDQPDISLFSGTGIVNSFYPVCQQDQNVEGPPCNTTFTNGQPNIQGVGGTSVATQAFAGIAALIVQHKGGSGLGLLNTRLYQLAGGAGATCTSSSSPPAACIFNDIPQGEGTNAQPCVSGEPNSTVCPPMGDPNSILTGFNTRTGYDEATGLGSVNVKTLIANY